MICPNCNSDAHTIKKGKDILANDIVKLRFRCKACNIHFYDITALNVIPASSTSTARTWVITTALNNSQTNKPFFDTILNYCKHVNADLKIIPVVYNPHHDDITWDPDLEPFFFDENVELIANELRLMAGIKILPTSVNPLAGYDSLSKGISLIIPSPQIMMKTIAKNHTCTPCIAHTTGCVSAPTYISTKSGQKAIFNHAFSALVVEEDLSINSFHLRVLNWDDTNNCFYDIDKQYTGTSVLLNTDIQAIVLGDEHIVHLDPEVKEATFGDSGMCTVLRPQYLIRHDVLDFYAASHHHQNDTFIKFRKYLDGTSGVAKELLLTAAYLEETTPDYATSIIVDSNHNTHIDKWLNTIDIKKDPENLFVYHQLMYYKLQDMIDGNNTNTFELWGRKTGNITNKLKFVSGRESFKLSDIELALHGHQGLNGSRGSPAQYARLGTKIISGHTHSPSIYEGAYFVGHSSKYKLDYNYGPSTWHQAHCLIQPNGKRQMIFIKKGKWRRT